MVRIESKIVFATHGNVASLLGNYERAVDAAADNTEEVNLETASEATTVTADDASPTTNLLRFDRILPSRITGVHDSISLRAFEGYASSLKDPEENPRAALLLLLPAATETAAFNMNEKRGIHELLRLLPHRWHASSGYIHTKALNNNLCNDYELRRQMVADVNMEESGYFDIFRRDHGLDAVARICGLKIMEEDEMFIAPAWPYRLEMNGTQAQQLTQFRLRLTSPMRGSERLVELRMDPERFFEGI